MNINYCLNIYEVKIRSDEIQGELYKIRFEYSVAIVYAEIIARFRYMSESFHYICQYYLAELKIYDFNRGNESVPAIINGP